MTIWKQNKIILTFLVCFFSFNTIPYAHAQAEYGVVSNLTIPTFDSALIEESTFKIKGFSAAGTRVEILSGARQLGEAVADSDNRFSIAVSQKQAPGQYQLVLRATAPSGHSTTSLQTLTITIPRQKEQRVLAMLDEPGRPSRLLFDGAATQLPKRSEPSNGLLIEYVYYEGENLVVSGRAQSKIILINIDNRRIAISKVEEGNRFFVIRPIALQPGDYIVSVDQIDDNGNITSVAHLPVKVAKQANNKNTTPPQDNNTPKPTPEVTPDNMSTHSIEPQTVEIRRGDTLQKISKRIYGSNKYANDIFKANRNKLSSQNNLPIGEKLVLPTIPKKTSLPKK